LKIFMVSVCAPLFIRPVHSGMRPFTTLCNRLNPLILRLI